MKSEFTYYAFICYSRKDENLAQQVQHYLEHYKLPGNLQKTHPHLPHNLRPVFRDKTDLAMGELFKALEAILACTRYLIVICTEHSAHPNVEGINYQDNEIRHFLSLRPENINRIIPIIFRKDESLSPLSCLPPSLLEHNILGIDVLSTGMQRAFADVAARMSDLPPEILWNRHPRESRRHRIFRSLITATGVLLALAGGLWWYWDYYTPTISYYSDYVECNNLPQGLFSLSEQEIRRRQHHYRFTTIKNRLRRVEYCNSAGYPAEHSEIWNLERPARKEFVYDGDGDIHAQILFNSRGKEFVSLTFTPNAIDLVERLSNGSAISTAVRRLIQRDSEGRIVQELYRGPFSNTPAKTSQGISGVRYERDGLGRIISVNYLEETTRFGEVADCKVVTGLAGYRIQYGNSGEVSSLSYINHEGRPTLNKDLWASIRYSYDENGNVLEYSYHDTANAPCLNSEGYARASKRYDERGNLIEQAYFGLDGKPCRNSAGYGRTTFCYDERGNLVEQAFFGVDGKPCRNSAGYGRTTFCYDERGNLVEQAFFGVDGKPCRNSAGYGRTTFCYDERGNLVEQAFFDVDGAPCLNREDYARATMRYDERRNLIEQAFFGVDGMPCRNREGYGRVRFRYDERNNLIDKGCYDIDGTPCSSEEGYSRTYMNYDERGNLIEQAFFGVDGKPCLNREGYGRVTFSYDEQGNVIHTQFYDAEGKRIEK